MKWVSMSSPSFSRKSSPRKTSSSGWNVKNSRNSPTPNRSFLSPPLPSHPSLSLSLVVQIRVKANAIWKTYLQDTDDGSCRINIDSRTRQECQQALLSSHPTEQIFEKAQSQIFQLMKYDSYSRFLKSHMYKECIMSEMEGKPIPYTKTPVQATGHQTQHQPRPTAHHEERSKTIDCLVRIIIEECIPSSISCFSSS